MSEALCSTSDAITQLLSKSATPIFLWGRTINRSHYLKLASDDCDGLRKAVRGHHWPNTDSKGRKATRSSNSDFIPGPMPGPRSHISQSALRGQEHGDLLKNWRWEGLAASAAPCASPGSVSTMETKAKLPSLGCSFRPLHHDLHQRQERSLEIQHIGSGHCSRQGKPWDTRSK